MTPESHVKKEIKEYLTSIGAYQFWPVQTGFGASTVDCLACINGCFFAIEVKRPGTMQATPRQNLTIRQVTAAKGIAFITDSLERVIKFVESFSNGVDLTPEGLPLSKREKQIFNIILRSPNGADPTEIRDVLYADDIAGGAQEKTLHVQICQLNKKLAAIGKRIKSFESHGGKRGGNGVYRLVNVPAPTE